MTSKDNKDIITYLPDSKNEAAQAFISWLNEQGLAGVDAHKLLGHLCDCPIYGLPASSVDLDTQSKV